MPQPDIVHRRNPGPRRKSTRPLRGTARQVKGTVHTAPGAAKRARGRSRTLSGGTRKSRGAARKVSGAASHARSAAPRPSYRGRRASGRASKPPRATHMLHAVSARRPGRRSQHHHRQGGAPVEGGFAGLQQSRASLGNVGRVAVGFMSRQAENAVGATDNVKNIKRVYSAGNSANKFAQKNLDGRKQPRPLEPAGTARLAVDAASVSLPMPAEATAPQMYARQQAAAMHVGALAYKPPAETLPLDAGVVPLASPWHSGAHYEV